MSNLKKQNIQESFFLDTLLDVIYSQKLKDIIIYKGNNSLAYKNIIISTANSNTQMNGVVKKVTDIFRRVKVRSKIANNVALFDKLDVPEGDNPEDIAYKAYGDADYFWVVCLMNNIVNRYYDWPLDEFNFQQFVADKYSNPDGIHHYEITQSSGKQTGDGPDDYSHKIEVNSDTAGAQSVSNIEYER